jgi:hypothetical protein
LGITDEEGQLIDIYQNKGRFLYRYAGTFLEEAAKLCLQEKYPTAGPAKIANTQGRRPATFEIDYLIGQEAFEIKWRDATTDGDHITKEHTRIKVIAEAGYTPIRIMFFYPNREQAIRIQQTLETLYAGVQGRYYYGDRAWEYIKECTGIDLRAILEKLAAESAPNYERSDLSGDCLDILSDFADECVNLIYLDPPFFTQKTHSLRTRDRRQEFSFADVWTSHTEYAQFIEKRLEQLWRVYPLQVPSFSTVTAMQRISFALCWMMCLG